MNNIAMIWANVVTLAVYIASYKLNKNQNKKKQRCLQIEKGVKKKWFSHSLSTLLLLVRLFITFSVADILCVQKEITMIQQEVSHLSFLACWPECINPVSVRMAALYLSTLMHITGGCHRLSIHPLTT